MSARLMMIFMTSLLPALVDHACRADFGVEFGELELGVLEGGQWP